MAESNEKEFNEWSRQVAEWLRRLADRDTAVEAASALFELRGERLGSLPDMDPDFERDELHNRAVYEAANKLLDSELDLLITRWVDRLIEARQNIDAQAAARVGALERDEKPPKFNFGPMLIADETRAAIQAAGKRIDPFLDRLIEAIPSSTRDSCDAYADAMRNAGRGIVRATSTLLDLMRAHGVWSLLPGIRAAMVQAAKFDPSILAMLRRMLHDDDFKVRAGAADLLGSMGDAAIPAADELLEMSARSVEDRYSATFALANQRPPRPQTLDLLEQSLSDPNAYLRRAGVQSIGELHADPERFVPLLIRACDDQELLEDESVPEAAVRALTDYGPAASAAIPRLRQFLDGPIVGRTVDPKLVRRAITAIAGVAAEDADKVAGIVPAVISRRETPASDDERLIPVTHDEHLCYIDTAGQIVLKTAHSYGEPFHCGRAIVHKGGKTFVIDRRGEVVFESKWRDIKSFHEGLAAVKDEKRWGFVDIDGKLVIDPAYYSVTRFSEGLAGIEVEQGKIHLTNSTAMRREGRQGFIDSSGGVVIPPQYLYLEPFSEGRATVCLEYVVKPNPIAGGQERLSDLKHGTIDARGQVIVGAIYSMIQQYNEGLAAVRIGDPVLRSRCGFIDIEGRVILPLEFKSVLGFREGLAQVQRRGRRNRNKTLLIDRAGNTILETELLLGFGGFHEGLCGARSSLLGNWGVIDTTGKMVIEPQFDDVGPFEGGIAPVTRDKWNGLIDRTGRSIWGPTTESVGPSRVLESEWY